MVNDTPKLRARWLATLVAVGAALAFSMSSAATAAETSTLCVKVPSANFRSGPGTDHDIVFIADQFFPVKVLEKQKGWVKVQDFEKETAWIAEQLLSKDDTCVVRVKRGNLRDAPGTKSEVVGHVGYGEAFRIVKRDGHWL